MSTINPRGRFCVIDSRASKWRPYDRHIAIVELTKPLPDGSPLFEYDVTKCEYVPIKGTPWKIDRRLKCIKRVIMTWDLKLSYKGNNQRHNQKCYWLYKKTVDKAIHMAERWDKLYPLHIIAKDWPLPLPYYPD